MRHLLAVLIVVPTIASGQAVMGVGDFISKTTSESARDRVSALDKARAGFCRLDSADSSPEWVSQFAASVAHDRASVTTRVVDVPLRDGVLFQHFAVSANQVRTDVADPDKNIQKQLRQRISDVQALADNGGAYAGHLAVQKLFNCGQFTNTFLSFEIGYGKLDAPGQDESGRYAGNATAQWLNRFALGKKAGDLELILGGRMTGVAGTKTLLLGESVRNTFVLEGFTVLKLFNANALTITYTGAPGQAKINKYFSKFAIGMNAVR